MVKPHMLMEALLPLVLFVVTFPSVASGADGVSGSDEGSGSNAPEKSISPTSTPAQSEPQSASKAGFFIGPTLGIFFVGLIAVLLLYFIYGEGPTNKEHKKPKKKKTKKSKVKNRKIVADSEQTPFLHPGAGVDLESQKMTNMVHTPSFVTAEKTVVMQMPPPQVNIFVAPPPPMGSMMAQQLPQWQAPPSSQGSKVSSFDGAWNMVPGVAPGIVPGAPCAVSPGGVPAVVPNMVPGAVPFVVPGAPWNVVPSGICQRPSSTVGSMAQQTATGAGTAANRGEHASTVDATGAGTAANLGEHVGTATAAGAAGDLSGTVK